VWGGRVKDDKRALHRALSRGLREADLVITTAGVSVGEKDFLRTVLKSLGAKEHVWRVALKPGKPLAFFTLDQKKVFALPGNPVSAFITCLLFVKPVLDRLAGRSVVDIFSNRATLAVPVPQGLRRQFLRGKFSKGKVWPQGGQESHKLLSLSQANALLEIPEGTGILPKGTSVRVFPLVFN
jgi:molybdopterin molybdotransferase